MTEPLIGTANKVFRAFLKDGAGKPVCGTDDCMLGARVPIDIKPDPSGMVHPHKGGMSATPDDPARLPLHFRPIALGGAGALPVFELEVAVLGVHLQYRPDPKKPKKHGYVEPSSMMTIEQYQAALMSTASAWKEIS